VLSFRHVGRFQKNLRILLAFSKDIRDG